MTLIKYIPAWDGNREKNPRASVEINLLTRRDIANYSKQIKRRSKKGFRDETEDNVIDIQEKQFIENIGKISDLKDVFTDKYITSGAELYDSPGMNGLVSEIIEAMEDASCMNEGLEKNLGPLSGGRSGKDSGEIVKPA